MVTTMTGFIHMALLDRFQPGSGFSLDSRSMRANWLGDIEVTVRGVGCAGVFVVEQY